MQQININKLLKDLLEVFIYINKAIHYLTLAANKDDSYAQYLTASVYLDNNFINKEGVYYLIRSSKNRFVQALFESDFIDHM